ncbi:MAG: hypothetical protein IK044_07070 [Methanobrevibacter sp.]|nr:hypothetical protein [Methanobrevibacter sp.]
MKLKLGIICGVLIWILTYLISIIVQPLILDNTLYNTLILPLNIIIVTGFFGIIYIRNIDKNELLEGILVGILFIVIDIILDVIFFEIPNNTNILISNYPNHIILMSIIMLIITSFLGYLAQMNIELK